MPSSDRFFADEMSESLRVKLHTVISMPSSARIRAAYALASSAVDILNDLSEVRFDLNLLEDGGVVERL